jgi:hypothetical protein
MSNRDEFPSLSSAQLDSAFGGVKTAGRRQSYNVEDRRPGAPPVWRQKVNTLIANWRNGYWY